MAPIAGRMRLAWLISAVLVLPTSPARVKTTAHGSISLLAASVNSSAAAAAGAFRAAARSAKPKLKTRIKAKGRARGPVNVGSKDGARHDDDDSNYTTVRECNAPFSATEKAHVLCPARCPLMRFDPDLLCHWRCIPEETCRAYPGVIDRVAGYCFVCAVAGCQRCASDEQSCHECHAGFRLENGECINEGQWKWIVLLAVLGVVVVSVMAYVVLVAWRPVVSQEILRWGLEQRSRSKARRDDGNHELYALNLSLADEVTSAGGIGAALHFSWQRMTLWWSIAVTVASAAVTAYHGRLVAQDALMLPPYHDEVEGICTDRLDVHRGAEFEAMRIGVLWLTGLVYVCTSLGAVFWSWWQQMKFLRFHRTTASMQDYALMCRGFPQESGRQHEGPGTRLEEECTRFFQAAWGESVIGVSVAWNMSGLEENIKVAVHDIVYEVEREVRAGSDANCALDRQASYISTPPLTHRTSSFQPRTRCLCAPLVDTVDSVVWGEVPPCFLRSGGLSTPRAPDNRSEALQLIERIPTTGTCFVVFRTKADMKASLCLQLPKFRGVYEISAEMAEGNAEVVLWDGFGTTDAERRWLKVKGIGWMLMIIAMWTACFWGPYTLYILSWSSIAGASQGSAEIGMVVGLLITVGNQVVYAAAGILSEHVKYTCRNFRDTYYTSLYTFAVLVNTVLDMWLVTIMATGWQRDVASDPDALVRNPSLQHAVFTQLIFYLWPGTLLLPFVLEPLVLNVCPYFLAKWLVRSRQGCSKQQAEDCLALPPFDLNRYGDNLINVAMVCLFCFLTASTLWWIFLMLSSSLLVIYAWDCYRFKRGTCRTHFATQDMDILSQYFMAVPCAILAGGFAFKVSGGQGMVRSWDPDGFLEEHPEVWLSVGAAFLGHLLVHVLLLMYAVPWCVVAAAPEEDPRDEIPYEVSAAKICCNWFNSNPVHCIRSFYLYQHSPPHLLYLPGREHVHKKNLREEDRDALIIYETQGFQAEENLFAEIRRTSSDSLWKTVNCAQHAVSHARRSISSFSSRSSAAAEEG
mmetsp:Transcript_3831/g.10181  ORF Transcript_3831/g.10181 Transcript_3831/m.10181 type:complete len:1031 (-) Transcript_3831:48-3140(-)